MGDFYIYIQDIDIIISSIITILILVGTYFTLYQQNEAET